MEIEDAEGNAATLEIEDAEENAATLEIEANEAVPTPRYVFAFVECSYPFVCICSLFNLWLPFYLSALGRKGLDMKKPKKLKFNHHLMA